MANQRCLPSSYRGLKQGFKATYPLRNHTVKSTDIFKSLRNGGKLEENSYMGQLLSMPHPPPPPNDKNQKT